MDFQPPTTSRHIKIAALNDAEQFKELQLSLRKSIHNQYTQRSRANEQQQSYLLIKSTKHSMREETFGKTLAQRIAPKYLNSSRSQTSFGVASFVSAKKKPEERPSLLMDPELSHRLQISRSKSRGALESGRVSPFKNTPTTKQKKKPLFSGATAHVAISILPNPGTRTLVIEAKPRKKIKVMNVSRSKPRLDVGRESIVPNVKVMEMNRFVESRQNYTSTKKVTGASESVCVPSSSGKIHSAGKSGQKKMKKKTISISKFSTTQQFQTMSQIVTPSNRDHLSTAKFPTSNLKTYAMDRPGNSQRDEKHRSVKAGEKSGVKAVKRKKSKNSHQEEASQTLKKSRSKKIYQTSIALQPTKKSTTSSVIEQSADSHPRFQTKTKPVFNQSSLLIPEFCLPFDSPFQPEPSPIVSAKDLPRQQELPSSDSSSMFQENKIYETSPIPVIKKEPRQHQHVFSFQMPEDHPSMQEESKEVTGFFGGNGFEFERHSLCNPRQSNDDQVPTFTTTTNDIPTPVFMGERVQHVSFRPSEALKFDLCKLNNQEDSLLSDQKRTDHQSLQSSVKEFVAVPKKEEDTPKEVISRSPQQPRFPELDEQMAMKTMVRSSSHNLIVNHSQPTAFQSIVIPEKKLAPQKSTGFFGKIRGFFTGRTSGQDLGLSSYDTQRLYKCRCGASDQDYACVKAQNWLRMTSNNKEFDYEQNKDLYEALLSMPTLSGSESQIERDIPRTFPNFEHFGAEGQGQAQLQRVLLAFSKYDSSIGYVQGMNFIVGAILFHCSEQVAFWLFVSLIEDFELRDIYQPRLPGLYKHSQVLQLLQMEHLGSVFRHFSFHNIMVEMYASDWIFALFANIIPVTEYQFFLDNFFKNGWSFFYKFSLSFLRSLQDDILEADDISEILTLIKLKNSKKENIPHPLTTVHDDKSDTATVLASDDGASQLSGDRRSGFKRMFGRYMGDRKIDSESYKDDSVWERLVLKSLKEWEIHFNANYIFQLLASFDTDKLVFKPSLSISPSHERGLLHDQDFRQKHQQLSKSTNMRNSSQNIHRRSYNAEPINGFDIDDKAFKTMRPGGQSYVAPQLTSTPPPVDNNYLLAVDSRSIRYEEDDFPVFQQAPTLRKERWQDV